MEIDDLVIDYLSEAGFPTHLWDHFINMKWGEISYEYVIDIDFLSLRFVKFDIYKPYKFYLTGIFKFSGEFDLNDPESFNILSQKIKKFYEWFSSIDSRYVEKVLNESKFDC